MIRAFPLFLLLAACGSEPPAPPRVESAPATSVPSDSLVLTLADSTPVRLTPGRTGTAADGTSCREFGVRVGERLVPLLYVREAPRLDGAGKLRAELSRDCVTVATYLIDPATAQPTLQGGR
jgi:hypothetical protein